MNTTTIKNVAFNSPSYDKIRMWLRDNVSPQSTDICHDDDTENLVIFSGPGWSMEIIIADNKSSTIIVDIEDDNLAVMFALIARDI
jgi:hypothetical protein